MATDKQSNYFILRLRAGLLLGFMYGALWWSPRHSPPLLPCLLIAGCFFARQANRQHTVC